MPPQRLLNFMFYRFIITLLLLAFNLQLNAQDIKPSADIHLIDQEISQIKKSVQSYFQADREFINGRHHLPMMLFGTHPYLTDDKWNPGSIHYKSNTYVIENNLLKYDIFNDRLIYLHLTDSGAFPVELPYVFIPGFSLGNRKFRYLDDFSSSWFNSFEPGYHEILYEGTSVFYKRWQKEPAINSSSLKNQYEESTTLIVKKDGNYHKVNNFLKVSSLLKDKRKEVSRFIKNNPSVQSLSTEKKIMAVLEYYDSISRN